MLEQISEICNCEPTIEAILKVLEYNISICKDINWVVHAAQDGGKN
jgi:hypothetical protein